MPSTRLVTRSGIIGSASGTQLKNCRPADLPINGIFVPKNLDRNEWSVGQFRSRFLGSNFIRIRMKNQILAGLVLLGSLGTALCGMVPRVAGDRDLVQAGSRQSYYRVSVDSKKWWDWGLGGAPVEEPSMQNRGYGWDAIAIPFDARGRVAFAPVYIYTITPDAYEEARLQHLYQGLTTKEAVLSLYGRVREVRHLGGFEVWYYRIRVWNPAEEQPSGHGR
jgi:hypothetical protein